MYVRCRLSQGAISFGAVNVSPTIVHRGGHLRLHDLAMQLLSPHERMTDETLESVPTVIVDIPFVPYADRGGNEELTARVDNLADVVFYSLFTWNQDVKYRLDDLVLNRRRRPDDTILYPPQAIAGAWDTLERTEQLPYLSAMQILLQETEVVSGGFVEAGRGFIMPGRKRPAAGTVSKITRTGRRALDLGD